MPDFIYNNGHSIEFAVLEKNILKKEYHFNFHVNFLFSTMHLLLPIIKFKIKFPLKANVLSATNAREENARTNSDGIARFV